MLKREASLGLANSLISRNDFDLECCTSFVCFKISLRYSRSMVSCIWIVYAKLVSFTFAPFVKVQDRFDVHK